MEADRFLKQQLDGLLRRFPPKESVNRDPIFFPRSFLNKGRTRQEIEAVGLLSAMLAYGAVPLFMRVISGIIDEAGGEFLKAISIPSGCQFSHRYRLSTAAEISCFCRAIGRTIARFGGLWEAFAPGWKKEGSVRAGLAGLHAALSRELGFPAGEQPPHGVRHLLPNPLGGGCVKRWHMYLRWMVRPDDGVDFGLWTAVPPSALLVPIDRHISRIARNLGLTQRKSDDWKTAEEITASLRRLDPADPVKYDFAMCHLGIAGECTHGRDQELCAACILFRTCAAGQGTIRSRDSRTNRKFPQE